MNTIEIRVLGPHDAAAYRELRLLALRESPTAFGSSYTEESSRALPEFAERLQPGDGVFSLGAWGGADGATLLGCIGAWRETRPKSRHKVNLWGMYVAPEARRRGVGGRLLDAALERLREQTDISQVLLTVEAANEPARRLYESRGFQSFGCEPDALRVSGVFHDLEYMTLRLRGR